MDDEQKTSIVIFGRDIMKIPCLRNAFLYSISSYIGAGLATFLFTSKPTLSSHVGFTAFVVVTFGYYTDCRLKYSKNRLAIAQIQESLHRAAVLEGTEADPTLRKIKQLPKFEDV